MFRGACSSNCIEQHWGSCSCHGLFLGFGLMTGDRLLATAATHTAWKDTAQLLIVAVQEQLEVPVT